jgi:peptide deformylase
MALDVKHMVIVSYPHPALRAKSKAVGKITDEVRAVAKKMLELMHEAPGVGLAAPQVGLNWRLFVANAGGDHPRDFVFVNPVLSNPSRETEDVEEGCLSLPDIKAPIRRPKAITITATDLEGNPVILSSDALPARIWQHETDHLDGILIVDRMSALDRMANQKKMRALEKK